VSRERGVDCLARCAEDTQYDLSAVAQGYKADAR